MKINAQEIVTLDFETYYSKDYTLSVLPTSEYILDEQFYVHGVGIKIGTMPATYYPAEQVRDALAAIDWRNSDLLAHNTAFDGFILTQHYGHKPRHYLDTLSMARGAGGVGKSNRLGALAERFNLGVKNTQALLDTKGKLNLTPEESAALGAYCVSDVEICFLLFLHLAGRIPPNEMDLINITLKMFCEPVLLVDTAAAQEELEKEVGGKIASLMKAGVTGESIMSNKQFAKLLEQKGVQVPMKTSPRTGKATFAFAKTDEGMKALLAHPDPTIQAIADARLKMKSTIGETRAKRLIEAGMDGAHLPVMLNYCGAHTTRWSAGNKMNMQNLPRGGALRKAILAPPGHKLVIGDSSQIEARLNAWFCDEVDIVQAFRDWDAGIGPDVYKIMASQIFNVPVGQVTKNQRQVGKVVVLALGYGMGDEKLQMTAANGKPPVKLDIDFCWNAVQTYRTTTCRHIAQTWQDLWTIIAGMYTAVPGSYKCISWGEHFIRLPSGLKLHYPDLQLDFNGNKNATFDSHGSRINLYGGLLLENIIQALARCIVADQMLEISRMFRVVMMAHDEIVCCVPDELVEACKQKMLDVLRTPPSWAKDLPLNAEVQSDQCYSK
jgi:DNA polymerase